MRLVDCVIPMPRCLPLIEIICGRVVADVAFVAELITKGETTININNIELVSAIFEVSRQSIWKITKDNNIGGI